MSARAGCSLKTHAENNHAPNQEDNIPPFPDTLCHVCKSTSSGVHYGVPTCEGCKGFFKRNIGKGQHNRCYFGGNCEITKETRNRCKSCRFQRCVHVGMALEAAKAGRLSKEKRNVRSGHHKKNWMKAIKWIAPVASPLQYSASTGATAHIVPQSFYPQDTPSKKRTLDYSGLNPTRSFRENSSAINDPLLSMNVLQARSLSSPSFSPKTIVKNIKQEDSKINVRVQYVDSVHPRLPAKVMLFSECNPACETFRSSGVAPFSSNENVLDDLKSPGNSSVSGTADNSFIETMLQSISPINSSESMYNGKEMRIPEAKGLAAYEEFSDQVNGHFTNEFQRTLPMTMDDLNANSSLCSEQCYPATNMCVTNSHAYSTFGKNEIPFSDHDFGPTLEQCLASNQSEFSVQNQSIGLQNSTIRDSFSPHSSGTSEKIHKPKKSSDSGIGSRSASVVTGASWDGDSSDRINFSQDSSQSDFESMDNSWMELSNTPKFTAAVKSGYSPSRSTAGNKAINPMVFTLSTGIDRRAFWLLIPRVSDADLEQITMLEKVIQMIDHAGHEVYGTETSNSVEFMVRRWQQGRLRPDSPVGNSNITAIRVRDSLKKNIGIIIHNIVRFSEKIPGFSGLRKSDMRILIEHCSFEMWLVQSAAFLVNNQSYILLPPDRDGDEPTHYTRHWMAHFMPESMIDALMNFADEINSYQLSFLELHLFKALVIVCPDRPGLEDTKSIAELKLVLQKALFQTFKRRQTFTVPEEMYRKVSHLMPHLGYLNDLNKKHIEPINMEKSSGWKVEV